MASAALQEIREELQQDFDRKAIEYEQRGEFKKSGAKLTGSLNILRRSAYLPSVVGKL